MVEGGAAAGYVCVGAGCEAGDVVGGGGEGGDVENL